MTFDQYWANIGLMFEPKYTISNRLLENIKKINFLIYELNSQKLDKVVLVNFEREAREVSAFASTSIEGNPLPLTDVKKILKNRPENVRDSEREVLNYNLALETLKKQVSGTGVNLSLQLILNVHKQVTSGLLLESGKLRNKPVVVNDPRTGKIVYLPPETERVAELLDELINFVNINIEKVDPLILAGILHKQMVIIHPFMDGNGRTTRLITKILLAKMKLDTFNLFSFESYYNKNVTKYFQFVGEFGDYNEISEKLDFTNWLEYFTDGIIDELTRVQKMLPNIGTTLETRLETHHRLILDYIKKNGFINDRDYSHLTSRAKATRTLDFNKLIELRLLERKGRGKNTHYVMK